MFFPPPPLKKKKTDNNAVKKNEAGKGTTEWLLQKGWSGKASLQRRALHKEPKWSGVSHANTWGRSIPGKEKSECKGTGVGTYLVALRSWKESILPSWCLPSGFPKAPTAALTSQASVTSDEGAITQPHPGSITASLPCTLQPTGP